MADGKRARELTEEMVDSPTGVTSSLLPVRIQPGFS